MLKYIISSFGEVIIGSVGHYELRNATSDLSEIVSAGRIRLKDGKLETYGKSYTFDIASRKEDAEIINRLLIKVV